MLIDYVMLENESYQKIVASKNEQVDELQNMLEMKEERMKELETQLTGKTKILQNGKWMKPLKYNWVIRD